MGVVSGDDDRPTRMDTNELASSKVVLPLQSHEQNGGETPIRRDKQK